MDATVECDALRIIQQATKGACERLRNPREFVVSWPQVKSTRLAVETVLEAIDSKLARLKVALEREDVAPADLRTTAENAVAQLRVALEWASVCSDGALFRRIQALADKCEDVLCKVQSLHHSALAATAPARRCVSDAWRQQLARLRSSPAWQELVQIRHSPAWARLVHGPGDAFELLKLGYAAKAQTDPSWGASVADCTSSIDSIRWRVSQLSHEHNASFAAVSMQHVSVTQIDHGPVQAFVCVRHCIRDAAGAIAMGCEGADVMHAPALPPGHSWEPCGAAVLFVSVWTNANLWFWKEALDPREDGLPGAAHGGFLLAMRELWPRVLEALRQHHGGGDGRNSRGADADGLDFLRAGAPLWLLGHSMGAALALLAAPRVLALLPPLPAALGPRPLAMPLPQVRVHVTGSPRVFDSAAAAAFDSLDPRLVVERHFHPGDFINAVPFSFSWRPGPVSRALVTAAALARDPDDVDAASCRGETAAALHAAGLGTLPSLDDVFGFRHVGSPLPRGLPREEVGWVSPWGAWAGSGFQKVQARRLHDASAYRRAEDAVVSLGEETCYPWYVQLALGGAALWAARRTAGRLYSAATGPAARQRWLRARRWVGGMRAEQLVPCVQALPFKFSAGSAVGGHARGGPLGDVACGRGATVVGAPPGGALEGGAGTRTQGAELR